MGLRILWQDIYPEIHPLRPDAHYVWDALEKAAKKIARPDTEVTISHVSKCCGSVIFSCLELLNKVQMVQSVIEAERQGYDAALMGCYLDPALREARGAVGIPVTAPAESAMLLAQLLGGRFGTVTVAENVIPFVEANIRAYGFEDRAIRTRPVRSFDYWQPMIDALKSNNPEPLIAQFEEVAKGLIRDGADVITVGCNYLGPVFTLFDYHEVRGTGVPVIDCGIAALKQAELLADLQKTFGLKRTTSSNSIYQPVPRKMLEETMEVFGYGKVAARAGV